MNWKLRQCFSISRWVALPWVAVLAISGALEARQGGCDGAGDECDVSSACTTSWFDPYHREIIHPPEVGEFRTPEDEIFHALTIGVVTEVFDPDPDAPTISEQVAVPTNGYVILEPAGPGIGFEDGTIDDDEPGGEAPEALTLAPPPPTPHGVLGLGLSSPGRRSGYRFDMLPGETGTVVRPGTNNKNRFVALGVTTSGEATGGYHVLFPSGTRAIFEPTGTTRLNGDRVYRLASVSDGHGNTTTYTYVSPTSEQLRSRVFPTGFQQVFSYAPSWTALGVEIRYYPAGVDPDLFPDADLPECRWGLEFDATSGGLPFEGAQLARVYEPATAFVADALPGQLHDLSTNQFGHRVREFHYTGPGDPVYQLRGHRLLDEVREYRASSLGGNAISGTLSVVKTIYYSIMGNAVRADSYTDGYGELFVLNYPDDTSAHRLDPNGTRHEFTFDHERRTTQMRIVPTDDAQGRPRTYDPENMALPIPASASEPPHRTLLYEYDDQNCDCGKLSKLTFPSGRTIRLEWDPESGRITKRIEPNPADGGETDVEYSWLWSERPTSYDSNPLLHRATVLEQVVLPGTAGAPALVWDATYSFVPRADGLGDQVSAISVKSSDFELVDESTTAITYGMSFGANGELLLFTDEDRIQTQYEYWPNMLLKRIRKGTTGVDPITTFFDRDPTLGYVTQAIYEEESGDPLTIGFTFDALGQITSRYAVVDGVPHSDALFFDRWGNEAVALKENRNSSGQFIGRSHLRTDSRYDGGRLLHVLTDRRRLDADDLGPLANDPAARMLLAEYSYDAVGGLTSVVLPNGATRRVKHDGYGILYKSWVENVTTTGAETRLFSKNFVDEDGAVVGVFEGDASLPLMTEYVRSASGHVIEIIEPTAPQAPEGYSGSLGGSSRRATYDERGNRVLLETFDSADTLLAREAFIRDALGRVMEQRSDAIGSGTSHVWWTQSLYRGLTQVERTSTPISTHRRVFDDAGRVRQLVRESAPTDRTVDIAYESGSLQYSRVERTENVEALNGAIQQHTYVNEYEWDALRRLRRFERLGRDGLETAQVTEFDYYTNNQTERIRAFRGSSDVRVTRFMPDALGRLRERTVADGSASEIQMRTEFFDWNAGEARESRIELNDGEDNLTRYTYDFAGRPVVVERPREPWLPATAHRSVREYDAASRVESELDGDGTLQLLHYDGAGRLLVRENPDVLDNPFVANTVTREVLERDGLGNVTRGVSYFGPLGPVMVKSSEVEIEIDSLGRRHRESYRYLGLGAFQDVTRTYDPTTVRYRDSLDYGAGGTEVRFERDSVSSQLRSMTWTRPGGSEELLAEYGHAGNFASWRTLHYDVAEGKRGETEYEFDGFGRLSSMKERLGGTGDTIADASFEFDAWSNLSKHQYPKQGATPNVIPAGDRFEYDEANRLSRAYLGVDAADIDDLALDPEQTQYLRALTYGTYDNGTDPYNANGLDDAGNRRDVVAQDGPGAPRVTESFLATANRYQDVNGVTQWHDGRGNLLSSDATDHVYLYDFRNRLAEVRNAAGLTVALYFYDAFGRRVIRALTDSATLQMTIYTSAYAGMQEVRESTFSLVDFTNTPHREFVWGSRLGELIAFRKSDSSGGWKSYFVHTGWHDSVTTVVDENGDVQERVEYTPFGTASYFAADGTPLGTESSIGNPYGWKGARHDSETGLVFMRHRHYSPESGRFVAIDPIGVWGDAVNLGNGYTYGANSPLLFIDPTGTIGGWCVAIVAVVIVVAVAILLSPPPPAPPVTLDDDDDNPMPEPPGDPEEPPEPDPLVEERPLRVEVIPDPPADEESDEEDENEEDDPLPDFDRGIPFVPLEWCFELNGVELRICGYVIPIDPVRTPERR